MFICIWFWIIIAVVAVLVLWVISVQNKLVKSDEFCNNALKQINVQQISRFDALQALIKLTREYASYEAETLQKIVDARKITSSAAPTAAQINANEEALKEISAKLIAVAEAYPDLKANQNYQQTMQSIEKYEENATPESRSAAAWRRSWRACLRGVHAWSCSAPLPPARAGLSGR